MDRRDFLRAGGVAALAAALGERVLAGWRRIVPPPARIPPTRTDEVRHLGTPTTMTAELVDAEGRVRYTLPIGDLGDGAWASEVFVAGAVTVCQVYVRQGNYCRIIHLPGPQTAVAGAFRLEWREHPITGTFA